MYCLRKTSHYFTQTLQVFRFPQKISFMSLAVNIFTENKVLITQASPNHGSATTLRMLMQVHIYCSV